MDNPLTICPVCGGELLYELLQNIAKKSCAVRMCIYCENDDFATDYLRPSQAVLEVMEAHRWNSMHRRRTDG